MASPLSYGDDVAPRAHSLVVKRWNPDAHAHECLFNGTQTCLVDLFVGGDLPDDVTPEDLIGKTVEVEYTHGWLWIAQGVRVVQEPAPALPMSEGQ